MATFLDQLFKSPIIFFIIAAVVLIVLSIIGKIPWPSAIDLDTRQRVGLAAFGTILIVLSVVVTSIEVISPPSGSGTAKLTTSSLTKTPPSGPTTAPVTDTSSCSSSSSTEVHITSPIAESKVPIVTIIQGTACNIPNGQELWMLMVPDGVTGYYPQLPGPVLITSEGKWSTSVHVGLDQPGEINKGFEVNAMLANQDGSAAIHSYFSQAGTNFSGLDPLPAGIQLVSQVHIIRK